MAESVYKIITLVGTSPDSWEKAAANAVSTAAKTLRDLRIAEIDELDMQIENGKVTSYRAKVRISFKYQGGDYAVPPAFKPQSQTPSPLMGKGPEQVVLPIATRRGRKKRGDNYNPLFLYVVMLPCLTSGLQPDLGVALVAIHRSALSGLEGYLRVFTTLGAYSRIHFPLPLIAIAIPIALLSPGRSAFRTTLGLIGKSPGSK